MQVTSRPIRAFLRDINALPALSRLFCGCECVLGSGNEQGVREIATAAVGIPNDAIRMKTRVGINTKHTHRERERGRRTSCSQAMSNAGVSQF